MTERTLLRMLARLACKYKMRKLYLWCVRMNQKSLHKEWGWRRVQKHTGEHQNAA